MAGRRVLTLGATVNAVKRESKAVEHRFVNRLSIRICGSIKTPDELTGPQPLGRGRRPLSTPPPAL
jgi:hypothetical protein